MAGLLNKIEDKFLADVEVYNQKMENDMKNFVLAGVLLIPLMIVVMVLYVKNLTAICRTGFKCFLVLPKKLIFHISTAKYIKQKKVLETIGWISLRSE